MAKKKVAAKAPTAAPEVEESTDETGLQDIEMPSVEGDEPISEETAIAAVSDPPEILRPSKLRELILKSVNGNEAEAAQVDTFRFLRDNGLPAPTRRYRVTGRRGSNDGPISLNPSGEDPIEVEAFDEPDAIRKALDARQIKRKDRHRWVLRAIVLEE